MLWWPLDFNHSAPLRTASKRTNDVDKVWPGVGSRALEGEAGTAGRGHSGSEPSSSSCKVSLYSSFWIFPGLAGRSAVSPHSLSLSLPT